MHYDKLFHTALEPVSIETGVRVGNYVLIEEIGRGGAGVVWLAVQDHLGREVALKVLGQSNTSVDWGGSSRRQARFHREVEIAAMLDHPNIARVFDSGFSDGVPYLVMEYVDGKPLNEYLEESTLTEREVIALMKAIAQGVHHAHQHGVIHRDLKPSNILVTKEGEPRIVDFGLAKALDSTATEAASAHVSIDGELVGTPAYMAPEQAAGNTEALNTRVDVYALGVILYEILTGRLPHDSEGSSIEVLRRISETEILRPSSLKPNLAGDLEALLLKALAKDPNERYSSAGWLADDLTRYLNHQPLNARAANKAYFIGKHLRRYWRVWTAVALGLLLVGAATARYVYDVKLFAQTEQDLRRTLAVEASAAEFRSVGGLEEADQTLNTLASALLQNPDNLAAATLSGMLLQQSAQLLPLTQLEPHSGHRIVDLRFAASAPIYATREETRVKLYSEETSESLSPSLVHATPITQMEISSSGSTVVTLQEDGTLSVWHGEASWQSPTTVTEADIHGIKISSDERWIGWITSESTARIWDWKQGSPTNAFTASEPQQVYWRSVLDQGCHRITFDPTNRYVLLEMGPDHSILCSLEAQCMVSVTNDASDASNPPGHRSYQFSQDGQRYFSIKDGLAYLPHYELPEESLKELRLLPFKRIKNEQGLSAATFLPQSHRVLVTGSKQVAIHDLETGEMLEMTPEGLYWPRTMGLSGDGKILAVIGTETGVNTINLETGELAGPPINHSWGVQKLAMDHEAEHLALIDGRGKLSVWDWRTATRLGIVDTGLGTISSTQEFSFSQSGRHLVVKTPSGSTQAWRLSLPMMKPRILEDVNPIRAYRLSPDTSNILTSRRYHTVLWNTLAGEPLTKSLPHFLPAPTWVQSDHHEWMEAHFSPDGDSFYLRNEYNVAQRHRLDGTPQGSKVQLGEKKGVFTLFPDPVRNEFVCSSSAVMLTVWDPSQSKSLWKVDHGLRVVWPSLSSKGSYFAVGTTVRQMKIWDLAERKIVHESVPHHSWITTGAWSSDEAYLATGAKTAELKVFSTKDWEERALFRHQSEVTQVVFHPSRPLLLSAARDGAMVLWDVETSSSYGLSMEHDSAVLHAAFSRDGLHMVSGCEDGTVYLWDVESQQRLCLPIRHPGKVTKVEFNANASHLVTLCDDGKVRVWPIFIARSSAPSWFPQVLQFASGSIPEIPSHLRALSSQPSEAYQMLTEQCLLNVPPQ